MTATLTMFVHGEAGTGKSWLGASSPAPRLVLDAEGRAKYLPGGEKAYWDPYQSPPPAYDGSWQTCIVKVQTYASMDRVYQWLVSGQHHFRSVVIDSVMEVQKRLIDDLKGFDMLDQRDWGVVLRKLEKLLRDYRDLVDSPSNTTECVVCTCGSRSLDGKYQPLLQGALRDTVPYFFDSVGFLYTTFSPEAGAVSRNLLVQPTPHAVAKDGTDRLPGPIIANPNLGQLFSLLNGHEVVETTPITNAEGAA